MRGESALEFESLIETMFTLASEGKTDRKGLPNPLRLAVIARAHFDTVRLPFPPAWLQRAALALGAPLGGAGLPSNRPAGVDRCESQYRPITTRTPRVFAPRAGSFARTRAGRTCTPRSRTACWPRT